MLVTHVLGDCPGCGAKDQFGNVWVKGNQVLRGCMQCKYNTTVWLPEIKKKIIYLDQFFFSKAFRETDPKFVEAMSRIRQISEKQLLVAPFSSIHEDETHQWRGFDGKNKDDLLEFIKTASRGHEFEPAYNVEQTQIVKAFQAFLTGRPEKYDLSQNDILHRNIHEWDDYYRIDVGRYSGNIEIIRDSKLQCVEGLVDLFPGWRKSIDTFDQHVKIEMITAAKGYVESYILYKSRIANGDHAAFLDSPVMSQFMQSLLYCFPEETPDETRLKQILDFFRSRHFDEIPHLWLQARIFATLKDMVKRGAYTDREGAIARLSGFIHDLRHISIYAPYCDAFIMDKAMASLISDPRINIANRYNVKVFSLNNWDIFLGWMNELDSTISQEHRVGLAAAYP